MVGSQHQRLGMSKGWTGPVQVVPPELYPLRGRRYPRQAPDRWSCTSRSAPISMRRCCALAPAVGALLSDQEIPLLETCRELSRAEVLKLWAEKCKPPWVFCLRWY